MISEKAQVVYFYRKNAAKWPPVPPRPPLSSLRTQGPIPRNPSVRH